MRNFEIDGISFTWDYEVDDLGFPWLEHAGHGIIRDVVGYRQTLSKKPCEVIIFNERDRYWLYDVSSSIALATRDGWGLGAEDTKALGDRLGLPPTKKQVIAEAVRLDMAFCRRFLSGDVCWFSVSCWKTDDPDNKDYLGGVLCEDGSPYLEEVAGGIAADFLAKEEANKKAKEANRKAKEDQLDLIVAGL